MPFLSQHHKQANTRTYFGVSPDLPTIFLAFFRNLPSLDTLTKPRMNIQEDMSRGNSSVSSSAHVILPGQSKRHATFTAAYTVICTKALVSSPQKDGCYYPGGLTCRTGLSRETEHLPTPYLKGETFQNTYCLVSHMTIDAGGRVNPTPGIKCRRDW